jgi:ubiquinone/menaquinone biosynthesis C-methylase UbiE
MATNNVTKDDVTRQFGRQSQAYATSNTHAKGQDLAQLLALLQPHPTWRVLDVATGAGHTAAAVAPQVAAVVATDLTAAMIARTAELAANRQLTNLQALVMDVENLQFPDNCFDAVTCRIAAHHFLNITAAVAEVARVLRPGGCFVLEDNCAPEDPALDQFINYLEKVRDFTHIRAYTLTEWQQMLQQQGLQVTTCQMLRKTHHVADWIARAGLDPASTAAVYGVFYAASPAARQHFEIQYDAIAGQALYYTDYKLLLRAEKQP